MEISIKTGWDLRTDLCISFLGVNFMQQFLSGFLGKFFGISDYKTVFSLQYVCILEFNNVY